MPVGELAAIINAASWAAVGAITKSMPSRVRPIHVVSSHVWITMVVTSLLLLAIGRSSDVFAMRLDVALIFAGGAIANAFGSFAFWMAISRGQMSRVYPTTQGLFILISLVSSALFFDSPLRLGVLGGAGLILSGVVLMNLRNTGSPDSAGGRRETVIIFGLTVITAICWVIGLLTTTIGLENATPLSATIIRTVVPGIFYIALIFAMPSLKFGSAIAVARGKLLAGGLVFTFAAWTFVFALNNASPGVVAVLINTSPLWAVVFGKFILRETIHRQALVGSLVCVAGIIAVVAVR